MTPRLGLCLIAISRLFLLNDAGRTQTCRKVTFALRLISVGMMLQLQPVVVWTLQFRRSRTSIEAGCPSRTNGLWKRSPWSIGLAMLMTFLVNSISWQCLRILTDTELWRRRSG